ncbi:MAG: GAF domain-containing sensor histidine kinase [Acidimicrobiales bacterium]|jgi:signal transduction histidine kinase
MMPLRSIDDSSKLRRVIEAMLLIGADLDLPDLLRHVIEEARSMTGARYGAIGVLNEERTALAEFITIGLDPESEHLIGNRPKGLGVLGLVITEPQPLRISDVNTHPNRYGFPVNHPPMSSFLGVPIKVRDEVYGNLYLTDKIGWSEFTNDDMALTEAFAMAAGIAVENARLHQRMKDAAVLDDRERLAGDLHDRVIQRIFAAGLKLQGVASSTDAEGVSQRLGAVISDLDDTIREIRSTIFELGLIGTEQGIRIQVITLLEELSELIGIPVRPTFNGPVDTGISDEVAEHLLPTLREAVTNIGRHAEASEATVVLTVDGSLCRLLVSDDGKGISATGTSEGGRGLVNLQRRAEKLHGRLEVTANPKGGTTLDWQVLAR